jgi:surface polysaccharide O-acyltransferase-like enzyme
MSRTSLALSNLRGLVILIVLAFHSALAYLDSLPATAARFDAPPYAWEASPIIDSKRWLGFDLFCAWHDIYLMSLMFFLSGLFVWGSLTRKGSRAFLSDRFLRLGLPLIPAVFLLMPIALYPAYLATTLEPSVSDYWQKFTALPFWPCGPQWFIWELLALNIVAAALYRAVPSAGEALRHWAAGLGDDPRRYFLALAVASAAAYIPLALIYSPWSWFQYGPVAFQWSRPLHYLVYFFAGAAVGIHGLDRGLLATDGTLARRWSLWLAVAGATFLLWIGPTALTMGMDNPPLALLFGSALGFVLACAGGSMAVLALALRFATQRSRILDSLSENAYGMYLVHYVFIVWLQYAVLDVALPAIVKASAVFVGTLLLSFAATAALRSIPFGSRLIGTDGRALAKAS